LETSSIIGGAIMRNTALRSVHSSATQRLGIYCLANRPFHEIRSAEPHKAHFVDHDDYIAERRQVRASRDAGSHHRGNLGNAQAAAHQRVVIKNSRRAV